MSRPLRLRAVQAEAPSDQQLWALGQLQLLWWRRWQSQRAL